MAMPLPAARATVSARSTRGGRRLHRHPNGLSSGRERVVVHADGRAQESNVAGSAAHEDLHTFRRRMRHRRRLGARRVYQSDRRCRHEGCTTVLSIYNPSAYCSLHERRQVQHVRHTARQVLQRVCANTACATAFVTTNPARVYCSDRCRMSAFQQRRQAEKRRSQQREAAGVRAVRPPAAEPGPGLTAAAARILLSGPPPGHAAPFQYNPGNGPARPHPASTARSAPWTPLSSAAWAMSWSTGSPTTASASAELPVMSRVQPGEIAARLPAAPPDQAEGLERHRRRPRRIVLPGITHWNHPGWFAYFPSNTDLSLGAGRPRGLRPGRAGHELADQPRGHRGRGRGHGLAAPDGGPARCLQRRDPRQRQHGHLLRPAVRARAHQRLQPEPRRPAGEARAACRVRLRPGAQLHRQGGPAGRLRRRPPAPDRHRRRTRPAPRPAGGGHRRGPGRRPPALRRGGRRRHHGHHGPRPVGRHAALASATACGCTSTRRWRAPP